MKKRSIKSEKSATYDYNIEQLFAKTSRRWSPSATTELVTTKHTKDGIDYFSKQPVSIFEQLTPSQWRCMLCYTKVHLSLYNGNYLYYNDANNLVHRKKRGKVWVCNVYGELAKISKPKTKTKHIGRFKPDTNDYAFCIEEKLE